MNREAFRLITGIALVAVFAFSLRFANFSHEPIFDELYHVLAGAAWADSGAFAIADGEYHRAHLFTRLVGLVYDVSGGSLDAVRMFGITLGTLLVVAIFLGVRAIVGVTEAYVAAAIVSVLPGAIFLSQFIRFYTLHALVFWLASIGIYLIYSRPMKSRTRVVYFMCAVLLLAFAYHLQVTTLIGLVGLLFWGTALAMPAVWAWFCRQQTAVRILCLSLSAVVALIGLAYAGSSMYRSYSFSPLWNSKIHAGYYFIFFRNQLGAFWSLLPLAIVLSLLAKPRPAFFFACVFTIAFLLQTFGGMRAERYLFYAMPFFATLWAIAITDVFRRLNRQIVAALSSRDYPGARVISANQLSAATLAMLTLCAVLMTPAAETTVRMVLNKPSHSPTYWHYHPTSWNAARPAIQALVRESDIFLTSQAYHAIYYIGDFDVEISANGPTEIRASGDRITIDHRTGRRVIDDSTALREIVACNSSGVLVVHQRGWRHFSSVNDDVADFVESHLNRVDVPEEWGMRIFRWGGGDSAIIELRKAAIAGGLICSN
jgi:hypothetical protein